METTELNFFDDTDTFGSADGASFAVALTGFDSDRESIVDETYFSVRLSVTEWGIDEEGRVYGKNYEIPSHECTREELGLDG